MIFKTFLFSEKKTFFLRKGFPGHVEIFLKKWKSFSLMVEKLEQNVFFPKKSSSGEKIPLDTYSAILTTQSKNFDKGPKNLPSMSENDRKQYKNFYFRKSLRLTCSYGHVKFCLVDIFFDRVRNFFGPSRNC